MLRKKSSIQLRRIVFTILLVFTSSVLNAHNTARDIKYDPEEVYKEKGLEAPVLKEGAIAIVDGVSLKISDYKRWLHQEIGFELKYREQYQRSYCLEGLLMQKDIDTQGYQELFLDKLDYFEYLNKSYVKEEDLNKDLERLVSSQSKSKWLDESTRTRLFNDYYLLSIYIIADWGEVHASLYKNHKVDKDLIDGADINRLLQLNNAFYLAKRLYSVLMQQVMEKASVSLSEGFKIDGVKYIEWIYRNYHSPSFTKGFISGFIVEKKAEEEGITISEAKWNELYNQKTEEYELQIKEYPEALIPGNASKLARYEFIKDEARKRLLEGRLYRRRESLKDHVLRLLFYDQYGYKGERCEVSEIFKWIRKRHVRKNTAEYKLCIEKEGDRVHSLMESLRDKILDGDVKRFPEFAMIENDIESYSKNCGYIENLGLVFQDKKVIRNLESMSLNELSPLIKTKSNLLAIVWRGENDGNERSYFVIAKYLPSYRPFNIESYDQEIKENREELKQLKLRIGKGEAIEKLAELYSDSFKHTGVDISEAYQRTYGFAFAEKLYLMEEGEMKIIESERGLHLVKLKRKNRTDFTKEIKDKVIIDYLSLPASDKELNDLLKGLFYEVGPYFEFN